MPYKVISNNPLFKDIFPDYETFKEWYSQQPLSDGEDDVPSIKTFVLILNEYSTSTCAMDEIEFKRRFANDLYTYYKEFEETTKAITELMSMSEEDFKDVARSVLNVADIPETTASTDTETFNFVSQQQKNFVTKSTLQIRREQIANKRILTVKTFLKRFKHLFRIVLDDGYTFVIGEPKGD